METVMDFFPGGTWQSKGLNSYSTRESYKKWTLHLTQISDKFSDESLEKKYHMWEKILISETPEFKNMFPKL